MKNKIKKEEKRDVPSISRTPVWKPVRVRKEKRV